MSEQTPMQALYRMKNYEEITVRLRFFGPYELIEARDSRNLDTYLEQNKKERFKGALFFGPLKKESSGGASESSQRSRAWVRGEYLRSLVINEITTLYAEFERHKIFKHFKICKEKNDEKKAGGYKRKHSRYAPLFDYYRKVDCSPDSPCDLCLIKKHVLFKSAAYNVKTFGHITELAGDYEETRHFCGGKRNKTQSVFSVYKGNHKICSDYYLTLRLGTDAINKNDRMDRVITLLAIGLAGVRYAAGALCRLDIVNKSDLLYHNSLIDSFFSKIEAPGPEKSAKSEPSSVSLPDDVSREEPLSHHAEETAKAIIAAIKKNKKEDRLRSLASSILSLGNKAPSHLSNVPEKNNKTGKDQLWGLAVNDGNSLVSIRALLINKTTHYVEAPENKTQDKGKAGELHVMDPRAYRLFFERTSALMFAALIEEDKKGLAKAAPVKRRDDIHYSAQKNTPLPLDQIERISLPYEMTDFIVTGWLEAKTPFFFGARKETDQLNDLKLIRDSEGNFIISYRQFRTALRDDSNRFVSACNYELGVYCTCPACEILRRIKPEDSINTTFNGSQFRQRISVFHETRIVDDGALFSQENGPQGLRFPFVLRYRAYGPDMEAILKNILGMWANGRLWLGGASSGKGRFQLMAPKVFTLDMSKRVSDTPSCAASLELRLKYRNFNGLSKEKIEKVLAAYNQKDYVFPQPLDDGITEIDFSLFFNGPVLSNDPDEALMHPDSPDAIPFRKLVVERDAEGREKAVYKDCLKHEGLKGLFLFLMGKNTGLLEEHRTHKGDSCRLCNMFGSEYAGSGILRIEDADLVDGPDELVRNDFIKKDWNQNGVDGAKFDSMALSGKDDKPLEYRSKIWLTESLSRKDIHDITVMFTDLLMNMGTVGGKGRWGFGWVSGLCFSAAPEWLSEKFPVGTIIKSDRFTPSVQQEPEKRSEPQPETPFGFDTRATYNPYYYITPEKTVDRSQGLVSHARYHDDRYSGKLVIELETLSTFFTPDTNDSYAFDVSVATLNEGDAKKLVAACPHLEGKTLTEYLRKTKNTITVSHARTIKDKIGEEAFNIILGNAHKSYPFKRRGKKLQIPGSTVSGAIAHIHQTLTNSCFRNLDQDNFIARRVDASNAQEMKLGRVARDENGLFLVECEPYRLPLYDDEKTIEKNLTGDPVVDNKNLVMASAAESNRTYIRNSGDAKGILKGQTLVGFTIKNGIATLCDVDHGDKNGYVKFTNLNNPLKMNFPHKGKLSGISGQGGYFLDITLNSIQKKKDGKIKPINEFYHDKSRITLSKRCERIIEWPASPGTRFSFSLKEKAFYKKLVEESTKNKGRLPKQVKTIIVHEELDEGAMVWFKPNGTRAADISPVIISSTIDPEPMLQRFLPDYENLKPCVRECGTHCGNDYPNCLSVCLKDLPQNLCPTCGMWGTTGYRGRVDFGIAELITEDGKAKWYNPSDQTIHAKKGVLTTLVEQHSPRETWPMGDAAAKIPGRKFYVNHPPKTHPKTDRQPTKNNASLEILDAGNVFRQEIVFHNLSEQELVTFLYCLVLEEGMAHRMGHGCNLGMGSVKIRIKSILVRKEDGTFGSDRELDLNFMDKVHGLKDNQGAEWYHSQPARDLRTVLRIPSEDVKIAYLKDFTGHEAFKETFEWAGVQAILSTPFHPVPADEMNDRAKAKETMIKECMGILLDTGGESRKPETGGSQKKGWKSGRDSGKNQGKRDSGTGQDEPAPASRKPTVLPPENPETGVVKWFNEKKGFGFIQGKGRDDVFVHHSEIKAKDFRTLNEGDRVSFGIKETKKGPNAVNVVVLEGKS